MPLCCCSTTGLPRRNRQVCVDMEIQLSISDILFTGKQHAAQVDASPRIPPAPVLSSLGPQPSQSSCSLFPSQPKVMQPRQVPSTPNAFPLTMARDLTLSRGAEDRIAEPINKWPSIGDSESVMNQGISSSPNLGARAPPRPVSSNSAPSTHRDLSEFAFSAKRKCVEPAISAQKPPSPLNMEEFEWPELEE